ncbi:UDP-glucose 4-epimerase GalE [Vagococcus penaei]|uniref:UDP-glucose 4-epimerase n=1 Tax=Vagococcus penaei TaxID=633807 RepID=A0A1Q2D7A0_9ENTE|nr:UDP-glucose 4-epimerase GalE [Vagococcus penaei]AQP54212.1 UDP-glucose 4-epimerase GalE [Vagococcus penaei]RST99996.1 UDP-glucose 4-epimerase GalE [Vagococcus penaei]
MTIAVLGGAGYIGSHFVKTLVESGQDTIVIDNLLTGHREAIHPDARFYEGDIRDKVFLSEVFDKESIDGVVHFAASSLVGESVDNPLKYFNNNVYGTQIVLEVMKEHDVKAIVFSSTAATYGEPAELPITETTPTNPKNPYGESKLMMEKMMHWCDEAYGIKYVALRYFNVAGASLDTTIGEDHHPETHLVPIILQAALGQREQVTIFGDDYATADGTCVRDYVHVVDLAQAHLLALDYLKAGHDSTEFNLGSSEGFSVKEMVEEAKRVTQRPIKAVLGPRRAGDPAQLVASSEKAQTVLGWKPQYTNVETIIKTAWKWHETHPNGYQK